MPSLRRRIEADDAIDYAVLGEPDETVIELMKGEAPARFRACSIDPARSGCRPRNGL